MDPQPATPQLQEATQIVPPVDVQAPTLAAAAAPASTVPVAPASSLVFDPAGEIEELKRLADSVPMPAGLKEKIDRMLLRLTRMVQLGSYSKEYEPVEQYIKWAVQIPWGKFTQDNLDLTNAQENLTKYHYGLQQIKDLILEYLAVMKLQAMNEQGIKPTPANLAGATQAAQQHQEMSRLQGSSSHAPILCFVGIQGVGKTSMAKSIGNALGRKFIRVALGALGNVSQIRGTPLGEENAEPGQIVKALIHAGTMNPLILLDEIDKTSSESGLRADLMAALLEILDPEQNSTFVDHYLDYPIDLSQCIFITTANNLGGISAALLDRLEVIRFGSYNDAEKQEIAKDYMLPKVREATGIGPDQLTFDDDVWPMVVRPLGFDAGVRQLERTLTLLARKVAKLIVEGKGTSFRITKENFHEFIPEDIGVYS